MPREAAASPGGRRKRLRWPLLIALGLAALSPGAAPAAELLTLEIANLHLPIRLDQLEVWSRASSASSNADNDLDPWLGLLEPISRRELRSILLTPLIRDQSFGRQLLDTWAGGQLLAELGNLLTTADGRSTTPMLQLSLRQLLEQRRGVTVLQLLQSLPTPSVNLQLDGLLGLGERWRLQLRRQQLALVRLRAMALPRVNLPATAAPDPLRHQGPASSERPRRLLLRIASRREPLPLDIWTPGPARRSSQPWVLMMPGLGGNADQLSWLAGALAARGWPVVVLQHPGSDAQAVKAALNGQRPPPGAETLRDRLADVEAVLSAQQDGHVPIEGDGVVLAGHSLGGLTALFASGAAPLPGLDGRCREALQRLPLHNPSRLIQCQLPEAALPRAAPPPARLRGLILLNSFGSLLWPEPALASLPVPVLMVGGSMDLVTPPLEEQLALFQSVRDHLSRLVVVSGGSHFSPVRLSERDEVLLRLGRELVGTDPLRVQELLVGISRDFLLSLERTAAGETVQQGSVQQAPPPGLPPQRRSQLGVTAFVLDGAAARRWRSGL